MSATATRADIYSRVTPKIIAAINRDRPGRGATGCGEAQPVGACRVWGLV